MVRFCERVLGYSYMRHRILFTLGYSLIIDSFLVSRWCTRSGGSRADLVCRLSILILISFVDSRSPSRTSSLARCWSRSLYLEVATHRESIVEIAPEVVRTCRYYVHMYKDSTHLGLLDILIIMAAYCLLPFMMSLHEYCNPGYEHAHVFKVFFKGFPKNNVID